MGIIDWLMGTHRSRPRKPQPPAPPPPRRSTDEQALERYRYMLRTAPPEAIEQAHIEAFAKLNHEQRKQVLRSLVEAAPPAERASVGATSPDDPQAMGQLATRTEMRQPGFMERTFGGASGIGVGPSLFSTFAMGFLGSVVANSFFSSLGGSPHVDPMSGSVEGEPPERTGEVDAAGADSELGDMDLGGFDI